MATVILRSLALALLSLLAACERAPHEGIDRKDAALVSRGQAVYGMHCAACHGANLEGQPNWRSRLPNGRMPAPPHDDTGHTWHHPDAVLFGITKEGLVQGKYAPPGYQSDMPGFGAMLTDQEIRAVLSFIQSRWSERAWRAREEMLRSARK
jgi:mono/diheme cytochrome c family protein